MIKVKKVHPNAQLPLRNNPTDAGADLFSVENVVIPAGGRAIVDTGIQVETENTEEVYSSAAMGFVVRKVPTNYYHRIAPRSGLAAKYGITTFAGVIDESYRGNIKVVLFNSGTQDFEVKIGDRIAQLITETCQFHTFEEVEAVEETARGAAGFGSSGK